MKTERNFGIRHRTAQCFIVAVFAAWLPILARAQAPTGTLQYSFTAQDGVPLWNLSGSYSTPYYAATNDTLLLQHFGKGNIYGSYQEDPAGGAVDGAVRGANSILRVKLTSKMVAISAFTDLTQQESAVLRNDKLTLTFDPTARSLIGTDRVVIKNAILVSGYDGFYPANHWKTISSYRFDQPVTLAVPESTDGSWDLDLSISAAGNKLTGTGLIRFANGQEFQFQLTGAYLPKTQKARILLKGLAEDKNANLVLSLTGSEMQIERMSGTVGGQRIRYPAH